MQEMIRKGKTGCILEINPNYGGFLQKMVKACLFLFIRQ